jgi:beta-aspartyl-peptidase (threonine type)
MPSERQPILLVHGGAWAIPASMREAHEAGVRKALAHGYALLEQGASALEAVTVAVSTLEDDETFDAGRGAFLTRDGRVQLDALLMDGATLRAGGVACVERLRNPIQAARLVLEKSPHVYFVGEGAEAFAAEHGLALIENSELVVPRERENLREAQAKQQAGLPDTTFAGDGFASHDTVGAVALDRHGNLAAGTSTGGTLNKAPGRVGDSSLIGCGCYADNASAAVSLTGWGEPIMKLVRGLLRSRRQSRRSATSSSDWAAMAASSCLTGRAATASPTTPPAWPGVSLRRRACTPDCWLRQALANEAARFSQPDSGVGLAAPRRVAAAGRLCVFGTRLRCR